MKLLFVYATSAASGESLNRTLEWQQQFTIPHGDCVAITDQRIDGLPMDQIVEEKLSGPGGYWRALARNIAFDEVLKRGADALVSLDSDGVFVALPEWRPSHEFEVCKGYMTEKFESLPEVLKAFNDPTRWINTSYWVISALLIKNPQFRSYLGFMGQGYEDVDFFHNVAVRQGANPTLGEARVIHRWHLQNRGRNQEEVDVEFLRNERLYETRKADFSKGQHDHT